MNAFLQDVRYGLRTLRQSPGFTVVAALTLMVGIGANTAIFSVVDALLLRPLPYDNAGAIVRLMEKPPGGTRNVISALNYLDWKKQSTAFEAMAAQTSGTVSLTGTGEPVLLHAQRAGVEYFKV